jgi:hypothetical protein
MYWSRIISHIHAFFKRISKNSTFYLCILILVYTIIPLISLFRPSDDYVIYEYFAEAVSKDINPYSIPSDYFSSTTSDLLAFGPSQTSPGVIRQKYADYPPLLMTINSLAYRVHNEKGLFSLYIFLYVFSIILYLAYANSRKSENNSFDVNPSVFLIFIGLNPVFYTGWFNPVTDKLWFPFFIMLLLASRNKPYWIAIILGLFAAIKGIGAVIMVFYIIYQVVNRNLQLKQIFLLVFIFGLILALSHLFWFPDWIKGYQWRAERQSFVNHFSLFSFINKPGSFWSDIPIILTNFSFLILVWFTVKHYVTLDEILTLPIVLSIIFNTELTYDRLLVVIFIMTLLARHNIIILISYVIGLFIINFTGLDSWFAMWGWTFFLLSVIGWHIIARNRGDHAVPQAVVVSD